MTASDKYGFALLMDGGSVDAPLFADRPGRKLAAWGLAIVVGFASVGQLQVVGKETR